MANTPNQVRDQFSSFFTRLSLKQKLTLFITLASALGLILLVLVWTAKPNYEVLFANLSPKDAGKILEKLKEKKIEYQLETGGTTIMVPTDKVYELRLVFAQEGLPESSSVGYEIFDKTNLGMTDFIQQVNYRRALEGELSRTIEQIDMVERARVHIVLPKESLFKEDQKQTSASVILKLKGNNIPSKMAVQGVSHLIASSVEGLVPENITIVDTRGRILSDSENPDDMLTLSATQLDFSKKVEGYLSQKAQSMLDQVVGPGNSVVRVTADLNFTQVEKNIEQYDPDNTAIRSEELQEESTPLTGTDSNSSGGRLPAKKSNSTVTNYEVNRTVQKVVEGVGGINRLSVAVMVNNKKQVSKQKDGSEQVNYVPRSEEEMQTLTDLVQTAVGYQRQRSDQVSVVNIDFSTPSMEEEFLDTEKPRFWDNWYNLIEKVFLFLAIIASMLIMRSLFSSVKKRNEEIENEMKMLQKNRKYAEFPLKGGALKRPGSGAQNMSDDELDNEVIWAEDFFKNFNSSNPLNDKLRSYIQENPEEAARLIKVWMIEDEEERG